MKITTLMKISVLAFSVLLASCQDNDITVVTDTANDNRLIEIAAPAGDITYKVSDLLEDLDNEYVFVGEDGLVNVQYSQDVNIDWESLVNLRDYSDTWNYAPLGNIGAPVIDTDVIVEFTEKVQLNHRDDVRYDSLTMTGGQLMAYLMVPPGTEGNITVTIPEITQNGSPFRYTFYAYGEGRYFQIDEELAGKYVKPSQGIDSSYISVVTTMELQSVAVDAVSFDFSLTNMQPGITFGYFGQQQSSRPNEQLTLDVFDELDIVDEIEVFDFSINLEVISEIGVPFNVIAQDLQFYDEQDQLIDVLDVGGSQEINLTLDPAVYADPIEASQTSFQVSRANSDNIVEIGNSYPRKVVFDVTSFSNPEGETDVSNFMGSSNTLQGRMNVVMPVWFNTSKEYARTDTIDFDLNDILDDNDDDARELETFTVWFDFYSKIPLDISARAWVVDGNSNPIDFLLGDGDNSLEVIRAGVPDNNGYVSEATHTDFSIAIDGDQINEFLDRNAMEIIIETKFNTGENQFVKIYDDMSFDAEVSFEGIGRIPSL